MAGLPLFTVDAFTDAPFRGNPAAVVLLETERDAAWMQAVGAEMNLAETAFVCPADEGFLLRWFTPAIEVDLCGHATLASAHVLWETGRLAPDAPAAFATRSGMLTCRRENALISMDFPAEPALEGNLPAGLTDALGVRPTWTGSNRMDYLVEIAGEAELRALAPDFARVAASFAHTHGGAERGVIVTARSASGEQDFVSRCFYTPAGINEDPVTGSAHCCLGPYWQSRLGKSTLTGYQASARGGRVGVRVEGNRVQLSGRAMTVLRGELLV